MISAESPGHADAGREVALVVNIGLCFVAEAEAQGHAGNDAPVVLHVGGDIHLIDIEKRLAGGDHILKRSAPFGEDLRKG